jgi:hypothetical protein
VRKVEENKSDVQKTNSEARRSKEVKGGLRRFKGEVGEEVEKTLMLQLSGI